MLKATIFTHPQGGCYAEVRDGDATMHEGVKMPHVSEWEDDEPALRKSINFIFGDNVEFVHDGERT